MMRKLAYVLGSQASVFASGLVKALVVPLALGLNDYAYWQIYVFYTVYVGVFTLGYGDGLYLRYGGEQFSDLPLERIRGANLLYLLLLFVSALAVVAFALANDDPHREIIFVSVALNVVILGATSVISLVLQATDRLKGYAFLNAADKIFFLLAMAGLLLPVFRTYAYLVVVDLAAKIVVLAVLLARYGSLFHGVVAGAREAVREFSENIGVGKHLLAANLSGMLVLGAGRIIVEYFGVHQDYAHFAFATSLASVVLMSVTALSIVAYPALKKRPSENYLRYFNTASAAYLWFAVIMLSAYFPAALFVNQVAVKYAAVAPYLGALFVITVLQGKMQLVNNTYYKVLRLERAMLFANLSTVVVVALLAGAWYAYDKSLVSIAYATMIAMAARVYASEFFLRRQMGEAFSMRPLAEGALLAGFLVVTAVGPPLLGLAGWVGLATLAAVCGRQQLAGFARQLQERWR